MNVSQLKRPRKGQKRPKRPRKTKKAKTRFSYRGKKNKKISDSGREIPFLVPAEEISSAGTGNGISLPLFKKFFWPFFAEKGLEGLKHPFWVKKMGGTFFLGGVKKHELGVRNYR